MKQEIDALSTALFCSVGSYVRQHTSFLSELFMKPLAVWLSRRRGRPAGGHHHPLSTPQRPYFVIQISLSGKTNAVVLKIF